MMTVAALAASRRRLAFPGHKLTMEWSGEYGPESSSTGYCPCGWSESASNQHEVRWEYRCHIAALLIDREYGGQ